MFSISDRIHVPPEMSKAERLLSYSLLSLITSKPLASASMNGISEEDGEYNVKGKGLLNEDGAWCWREGCGGECPVSPSSDLVLICCRAMRLLEIDEGDAEDFGDAPECRRSL
jgi:hypothetical protein